MHMPFLIGEQIYLRSLAEDDLDRCMRWINDPEILSTLGRRFPMSQTLEREWITSQYKSEKDFSLAIALKDGDLHIGNCGLHQIDYQNRNAEFGIMIGEKEHWGHGYALEAAKLILQYGFDELNLHRISLEVYSHNERAQRAYEKAGFVHEGTMRESYFRNGTYHDTLVMAVLKSDWRAE